MLQTLCSIMAIDCFKLWLDKLPLSFSGSNCGRINCHGHSLFQSVVGLIAIAIFCFKLWWYHGHWFLLQD